MNEPRNAVVLTGDEANIIPLGTGTLLTCGVLLLPAATAMVVGRSNSETMIATPIRVVIILFDCLTCFTSFGWGRRIPSASWGWIGWEQSSREQLRSG